MSKDMLKAIQTIRDLNPEYEYHLYDDTDRYDFIKNYYPQLLDAYENLLPGAFKADLWRLLIIYQYGGVYIDIKQVHFLPFSRIIRPDCKVFVCQDLQPGMLWNALFGAVKNNPYIEYYIVNMIININNNYYSNDVLGITGPKLMGECFNKMLNRHPKEIWELRRYNDVDVVLNSYVHNDKVVDKQGVVFGRVTYDGYYSRDRKQDYREMYRNRNIFKNNNHKELISHERGIIGNYPIGLKVKIIPEWLDNIIHPIPVVKDSTLTFEYINKDCFLNSMKLECSNGDETFVIPLNGEVKFKQLNMGNPDNKIPKTIFQTGSSNYQEPFMYEPMKAFRRLNPEYDYYFSDNHDRLAMIKNNFSSDILQAYNNLAAEVHREELWACCVLYLYGGVYLRNKASGLRALRDIIPSNADLILCSNSQSTNTISGDIICSVKEHPYLKLAIDIYVKNILNKNKLDFKFSIPLTLAYSRYHELKTANENNIINLLQQTKDGYITSNNEKVINTNNRIYDEMNNTIIYEDIQILQLTR